MENSQLNILYQSVFPKFKSWIINNLGSVHDAHDTFQEVLEILIVKDRMGNLNIKTSLSAYVLKACKYRWIDHLRARKRSEEVVSLNEAIENGNEPTQDDYEELQNEKRKYDLLDDAFSKLTELCRKILTMVRQGKKPAEIAKLVGARDASTVNRRKFACMQSWKKHLKTLKAQTT